MVETSNRRLRLVPEMASLRLLVLKFVREYIAEWGHAPSQSEIANGCSASRQGVQRALRSLARDGLILRLGGERGLALPSERDEAIATLRRLGCLVDADFLSLAPAARGPIPIVLPPPELTYRACDRVGDQVRRHADGGRQGGADG